MAETNEEKLKRALELKRQGVDLEGELKKLYDEFALKMADANESLDDRIKRLEKIKNQKEEELALAHQLADMGLKLEGHYDTIYAAEEAKLKLARQNVLEMERGNPLLEEAYQLALKINTEEQNALKARKEAAGYTEGLIDRLTGISDKPTSGIAKMFSNPEGFAKGFKDGVGKMITPMNIMTSTIDKVVETTMALAIEQDAAISGFRKATGATGAFDDDIVKLEKDLRAAGVTSSEAAESVQNLYLNVSGFTEMGAEARAEMEGMVAVLAEVGVAAADSTKNIQIAIKGLGMSKTEATMLQSELRSFAQGINVSVGQLSKDFGEMGPQIVAMGDKGVGAFEKLQVTMKETGLEMSTMLKIVGQFDTFDGAGQQVGKLNALLGGPFLNTLDLVSETDLGARMEKLRDGVMAAGVSFDDLSYYQRKAYTSALGLNSEMELAMFLGNNMDSIIPEQKNAEEMAEIAKQTAEFNTVMDELRQAGMSLAVSIRPLVSIFKGFLQIIEDFGPLITSSVLALGILRTALHLNTWSTKLAAAADAERGIVTASTSLKDKLAAGWLAIKAKAYTWLTGGTLANTGAQAANKAASEASMLADKAAALAKYGTIAPTISSSNAIVGNTAVVNANQISWWKLGAAFFAIAFMLYKAIASPGLITIIGILTIAMFGLLYATNVLGWSLAPVIPVLYAFGGAVLLMGLGIGIAAAGIGLAAAGMSLLVTSIGNLGPGFVSAALGAYMLVPALVILTVAMFGLLFAASALGWSLAPTIPVLYALGGAMLMVGIGVGIAGAGMSLFVDSLSGLAGLHGDIFKTALAIHAVADALDDIPLTKTVAVAAVIMPLAAMAPVAMVAAAGAGEVTRGIGGGTAAAAAGPAQGIGGPTAPPPPAPTGPPPVINVHLSVDGTEFATAVNKVEIEKYVSGGKSDMHASIVDMLKEGFLSSS